jgi:histidine triad (HIT) family protein
LGLGSAGPETRLITMMEASCIFCKIVSRDIPADFIAETANTLAFRDIAPLAEVHLLIIPKSHHRDVVELSDNAPALLSEVIHTATELAKEHTNGSFKLQFNTGAEAGQTIFHAHAHVLSDSPKVGS